MTIEIITAHEADQIIAMRTPLAWPPHNACNNNCNQGRACDCTMNVEEDEWAPKPPMRAADALLACTLVLASWGAVTLILLATRLRL